MAQRTVIVGPAGAGKTRETLQRVAQDLRAGQSVALLSFDYDTTYAQSALRSMGLTDAELTRFHGAQMHTRRVESEVGYYLQDRTVESLYVDAPLVRPVSFLLWLQETYPALRVCLTLQAHRAGFGGFAESSEGFETLVDHVVRVERRACA